MKNKLKKAEALINIAKNLPINDFVEEDSGLDGSYFDVNVTANNVEVKFYGNGDGVELYLERTVVEV